VNEQIIFDSDPKALVERVLELVKRDKEAINAGVRPQCYVKIKIPADWRGFFLVS